MPQEKRISISRVNVGVIDVGQMGAYYAQIYQKLPQAEPYALCEFNDSRRKELETEFPGITLYRDYRELLEDIAVEVLSIILPSNLYQEAVEPVVQADRHMLLEKSLVKELEDGKALYEIIKDYDKVFTTDPLPRFDPRFAMVKERLDNNELGDIIHCYVRRNSPTIGPRCYIDVSDLSVHITIHDINHINWWMDCQSVKVFAKNHSVLLKRDGMNDVICALATYEDGAVIYMEACWILLENSPTIIDDKAELIGIKGVACVNSCDHDVRFVTGKGVQYLDSRRWYYINDEVCRDLAEKVVALANNAATNTKSATTPKQSCDTLRVVDTVERSIAEGKEIVL